MSSLVRFFTAGVLPAVFCFCISSAGAQEKLVIDASETMGMSMFRAHWDTPIPLAADGARTFWGGVPEAKRERGAYAVWTKEARGDKPGALAFDALNRSLLVRFPDAADKIAAAVKAGKKIEKVELVLPFKDEELFAPGVPDWPGPDSYNIRTNWGIDDLYIKERPTWHAIAYALRRPWVADEKIGPTFNAAVNGAVYWTKYGAGDEKTDRFPARFGPAEVSYKKTDAMDITSSIIDAAYGASLGERLRRLSDCGFAVRKWESYDHRYFRGVYEFATATGGRGILVDAPRLEVTLGAGKETLGALPPATDVQALAARLAGKPQGAPTAVIPPASQIEKWAQSVAGKPAWMSEAQWNNVQGLWKMSGRADAREPLWTMFVPGHILNKIRDNNKRAGGEGYAKPEDVYAAWVDGLIARQTRGWSGFETATEWSEWQNGKDILPGPAKDAVMRYWTDWLMPDRATAPVSQFYNTSLTDGSLIHPMADQLTRGSNTSAAIEGDSYWLKTGDWRGNKSFFRSGFTYVMSTQNFNTTSSTGALLFGNLIGAPRAVVDGKNGVDKWLLNGWIWSDGTGQEFIDHYYYAVTLKGIKALQNGASDAPTKLMADSLVTKGVDEALLAWHPNLKRFIAPASRTSLNYLLATQDGLAYIMQSLSNRNVLTDVGTKTLPGGYPVFGEEAPPALIALLSLSVPWAPPEMAKQVDEKPLPWEATTWGGGTWRRTYLGENYGLGSALQAAGRIQAMAQWRREAKEVTSARDLGTLDVRMGINETRWANDAAGWIGQPYKQTVAQNKNSWLVVDNPSNWNGGFNDGKTPTRSVQSSLGFFDMSALEPGGKPTWEIYSGGKKVESLPVTAKQGEPIFLRDGVTYIGIIPLPATDLGRDAEVVLEEGKEQKFSANGLNESFRAGLVINSYIVRKDEPLGKDFDWYRLKQSYAGFAVQFGDAHEYPSFDAFRKKFEGAQTSVNWDGAKRQVSAAYTFGNQKTSLQLVTAPEKNADGNWDVNYTPQLGAVNDGDKPLYPSSQVLLDTPLEAAGWNAVEKNGAKLSTSQATGNGARLFLQTSVDKRRFVAWNPQGVPADLQLALPDGSKLRSDGLLGLTRISVDLDKKTLAVDHAFTDGREAGAEGNTNASALLLSGWPEDLKITLNGVPYAAHLARATIGETAWRVLPLSTTPRTKEQMAVLLGVMDKAKSALAAARAQRNFLQVDYAGPFPQKDGKYGPETDAAHVDLSSTYAGQGESGEDIKWRNWGTVAKSQIYGGWTTGSQFDSVFMFRHNCSQAKGPVTYFLHADVRAQTPTEARVTLAFNHGGSMTEGTALWLNGVPQKFPSGGGSVAVKLAAGENHFLWKVRQKADMPVNASDGVMLTLGEPVFGLPLLRDVDWKATDGSWTAVNPQSSPAS